MRQTYYQYDVDYADVPAFQKPAWYRAHPTHNNRLLSYEVQVPSGLSWSVERTVLYTYWETGDVSNITVLDHGALGAAKPYAFGGVVRDLGLWYNLDGSLWVAAWSQWAVDPNGVYDPDPNDPNTVYQLLAAREFRGSGMGRYLVRDIDVSDPNQFTIMGPTVWTDRLGGAAYSDFETDYLADPNDPNAVVLTTTERSRYHGHARGENTAPAGSPESWTTRFERRDMLGSLTQQTDPNGVFEFDFGYTAFGELLGTFWDIGGPRDPNTGHEPNQPPPTRQMYAGAWQYESDLLYLYGTDPTLPPITLQHVGYRWYQPEIGRFVQRDPIGIRGGVNTYLYVCANPLMRLDPVGLDMVDIGLKLSGICWGAGCVAMVIPGGQPVGAALQATAGITCGFWSCVALVRDYGPPMTGGGGGSTGGGGAGPPVETLPTGSNPGHDVPYVNRGDYYPRPHGPIAKH